MSGRWRRLIAMVSILAGAALLAGCGAVSSLLDTDNGLRNAGFQSVSVKPSGNDLNASVTVSAIPTRSDVEEVASVVWRDFHERFDNLNVTVHGQGQTLHQTLSFDQVQQLFGARNPAWNRHTLESDTARLGLLVLIGLGAAAAVVVAIVLIVARRNRRRGPPPWPPGPYPGYSGPPPGAGQAGGYPGSPPYYPPPPHPPIPDRPAGGWGPPPPSG